MIDPALEAFKNYFVFSTAHTKAMPPQNANLFLNAALAGDVEGGSGDKGSDIKHWSKGKNTCKAQETLYTSVGGSGTAPLSSSSFTQRGLRPGGTTTTMLP